MHVSTTVNLHPYTTLNFYPLIIFRHSRRQRYSRTSRHLNDVPNPRLSRSSKHHRRSQSADPLPRRSSSEYFLWSRIPLACHQHWYTSLSRSENVLLGYSQGASLVLQASSRLGKKALEAIKAIILVGNPYRIPGKSANVDSHGNTDARGNIGMFVTQAITSNTPIPQFPESLEKSGKVLDYCLEVCDNLSGI